MHWLSLLAGAAVGVALAYLLSRMGRAARALIDEGSEEAGLSRVVQVVRPLYEEAQHPTELLEEPAFAAQVELVAEWSTSTEELLKEASAAGPVATFLALATAMRRGDADLPEELVSRVLNEQPPFVRHLLLRAMDELAAPRDAARAGVVLRFADETWGWDPMPMVLGGFLEARASAGDHVDIEALLDELGSEKAEAIGGALERVHGELAEDLRERVSSWSASRVDVELLKSIGRVRAGDEVAARAAGTTTYGAFGAVVDAAEASLRQSPARSVMLVGAAGVGKSSASSVLAERLSRRGWVVFEAGPAELVAGQSFVGQLEERMRKLVEALSGDERVLWIVPDFPAMAWSGRGLAHRTSALDLLLPNVEQGRLCVLAEAGSDEWERLVREAPRVSRAFDVQRMEPAPNEQTRALALKLLESSDVKAEPDAATLTGEAMVLADQFLTDAAPPGHVMELLSRTLERLRAVAGEGALALTLDDLVTTLTTRTGLPASILDDREALDLDGLRSFFVDRVMGQAEAVSCLVDRVAMIKAGVTDPTRPRGVFLFVGPTGTGKTEIAKTLATWLFGSPSRMVRLDMSEMQNPDSLVRLTGSPETHAETKSLVEEVRAQPFSVVLLDEFEKAHPRVWDLFLQVFDDGRLTDNRGHVADFRHSIIILTSNVGTAGPATIGIGAARSRHGREASVQRAVAQAFRPELLNRIDRVVVFRSLGRSVMRKLLKKEIAEVFERRGLRQRSWAVEWDDSALELLLEEGFSPELGARPLKRAVERLVLAPLAKTIVQRSYPTGDQFLLVRAAGRRLEVEFIDPDAGDAPAAEHVGEGESEGRRLAAIALDPHGSSGDLATLRASLVSLEEEVAGEAWTSAKSADLARTSDPEFWSSRERFTVLDRVEVADHIEAAVESARRLLDRLDGATQVERRQYPRPSVGRLAERLTVLSLALDDLRRARPSGVLLCVEGLDGPRTDGAFAGALEEMYRAWASKRGMTFKTLAPPRGSVDRGPANIVSVSGLGVWSLLAPESGLHVHEEVPAADAGSRKVSRTRVRVRVAPAPLEPPSPDMGKEYAAALDAVSSYEPRTPAVVRTYRETPSPLVRDHLRGLRTGRIKRVLGGDFDLVGLAASERAEEGERRNPGVQG